MYYLQKHKAIYMLLLAVYSVFPYLGIGQTASDDLIAMGKKFSNIPSYDITVDIKVYKDSPKQEITFSSKGRTAKLNDKFYLNILNRKTIVNNQLMLLVDDKQKMLMYTKINKEQMAVISSPQNINVDSLVKSQKTKTRYLVNTPSEKKIEILPNDGSIKSISMSFNPKTLALKEIIYLYTEEVQKNTGNAKVIVTYSNFSGECKSPELFDQSSYIKIKKDKIEAREAYKNYKLVTPQDFQNK